METKICTKCKEELPVTLEYFYLNRGKLASSCKKCQYKAYQIRMQNPEYRQRVNERAKRYKQNNLEKVKKWNKKYNLSEKGRATVKRYTSSDKGRETMNKLQLKYRKRDFKLLADSYIKNKLTINSELKWEDIPQELIEIKRKQLKLYRDVKKQKNQNK